jgi:hypothetical protein
MMITSAKLSSRSIGVRTFFARQLMLVMVAAALFAILWVANVRGPGMGLLPIILYSLFIGNLTTPIMNRLAPRSSRLRFPWDWAAYLIFLFFTAVAIASLTVAIIMPVYRIPISSYFSQLWSAGRLVVVVVLVVGTIRQEFGEGRLLELCSNNIALSAAELLTAIRKEVVSFCNGNFQDDFTLVVVAVK